MLQRRDEHERWEHARVVRHALFAVLLAAVSFGTAVFAHEIHADIIYNISSTFGAICAFAGFLTVVTRRRR